MMVDFAGTKAQWIEARTGEVHQCEVLVATMPYSSFTYVFAVPSQKQSGFVTAINEALKHLGGTPAVLTSDNLKSYVSKASRYEPKFTEFCSQMGSYYTMELDAMRVRKLKDKASVERHVTIVYNQIYAPLRDKVFHSLEETQMPHSVSKSKRSMTKKCKANPIADESGLRQSEKPFLRPLPSSMFEPNRETIAKVQRNYHVILGENNHYYSVPYKYIGRQTQIIYTNSKVEIYCGTERN